jgi:hypothetical protein
MITRINFAAIDADIKKAITDTLDHLRQANQNDYLLLLADAEYKPEYAGSPLRLNPYVIENKMDLYRDEARLQFLADFLTSFYSFPKTQVQTDDNHQRLHMELMVYTHIWESKSFLKKLYRLAHLVNNEPYAWSVAIPDMGKHDFIRNDIRQLFINNTNRVGEIIRNGFHTSLRNAFAHSEYFFDTMNGNRNIILDNYGGAPWELKDINFDDWSSRFVHSALLSYYLFHLSHMKRQSLIQDLGSDTYTIIIPISTGGTQTVDIQYRQQHDAFNFL